jgi:hypothetical protein
MIEILFLILLRSSTTLYSKNFNSRATISGNMVKIGVGIEKGLGVLGFFESDVEGK